MSPEVYSTYIIEDGEVNKEAMKENNLLDYEGQYSTSVQIKVLNVVVFKLFFVQHDGCMCKKNLIIKTQSKVHLLENSILKKIELK